MLYFHWSETVNNGLFIWNATASGHILKRWNKIQLELIFNKLNFVHILKYLRAKPVLHCDKASLLQRKTETIVSGSVLNQRFFAAGEQTHDGREDCMSAGSVYSDTLEGNRHSGHTASRPFVCNGF